MISEQIHASCVAFGDRAVLIRGESGSGKSDLVLRLIDSEGYGLGMLLMRGMLVADDQVVLTRRGETVYASPPATIAGKMEIRGQGIVEVPWVSDIAIYLVVDLMAEAQIPRMPEAHELTATLLGLATPRLALDADGNSAPARIRSKCFSSAPKTR
jgi:HPr kinase/phosphorylase